MRRCACAPIMPRRARRSSARGAAGKNAMMKSPIRRIAAVAALVVVGLALVWLARRRGTEVRYATAPVDRGDVLETVGATGTLQAVVTVQVGSQVSGTIQE